MQTLEGLAEGQVLQRIGARGANATLSGLTRATGSVLATISNSRGPLKGWKKRPAGQAERGKFRARLEGIPAGGPYRLQLQVEGERIAGVKSFLVGDVWLLAGQSNMQGCGLIEGAAKSHPLIRAFSMRREWRLATEPLHLLAESPDPCHTQWQCTPREGERGRKRAIKGTGVGLFFAREMLERSGVPQGLICTAHGGTSMEQWNPERKNEGGASLYGSMFTSVRAAGQPVAGMLWYQGESDATPIDAPLYEERMKRLVAATRRDLRQPGLPWLTVQIARAHFGRKPEVVAAWNRIQEIQRLLPKKIRRLETVAAIDLPLEDNIHIGAAGYSRLAARLARAADRLAYGNRREKRPPQLKSVSNLRFERDVGHSLDVVFDPAAGGLRAFGEPHGFSILTGEGEDLDCVFKTVLKGGAARLHVGLAGTTGLSVAYGHGITPVCNITDGRDEAVPAFGPLPIRLAPARPTALLPFVRAWRVTGILPPPAPLAEIPVPDVAAHGGAPRIYPGDFVEDHASWQGHSGHVYFASRIELPEPMRLDVLMGYDGPFRLWIDGKPLFEDLEGTNPALVDEKRRTVPFSAGSHDLRIAMDINEGTAWGFFLRFRRKGLSRAEIVSGDYTKPAYLV